MKELNFRPIFNVKYMPEFNPIETVFAHMKRWYAKQRTNALVNGEAIKVKALIRKAFKSVRKVTIKKSIERSLRLI